MFRPSRTSVTVWIAVVAVIAGLSYVLTGAAIPPASAQTQAPAAVVEFTLDGKLKQPVGYRKWVHVGTPLTPKELNDDEVSEFHAVYMDPESFDHYEKTGKLRDGTVMIKEFVGVGSKEAVSGKGYFMGEFTGLEASIKDSKRFKDEPGNWAYFNFGTSTRSRRRCPRRLWTRATRAIRTTPRRTGSSASITPSCAQRPRARSDADRGARGRSSTSRCGMGGGTMERNKNPPGFCTRWVSVEISNCGIPDFRRRRDDQGAPDLSRSASVGVTASQRARATAVPTVHSNGRG